MRAMIEESESADRADAADRRGEAGAEGRCDDDILELTDIVAGDEEPVGNADTRAGRPPPQDVSSRPVGAGPGGTDGLSDPGEGALISDRARDSVIAAVDFLERGSSPETPGDMPRGRAFQDLVIAQLRPMMARWLDEHLPGIVERVVEREFRHVTRRRDGAR